MSGIFSCLSSGGNKIYSTNHTSQEKRSSIGGRLTPLYSKVLTHEKRQGSETHSLSLPFFNLLRETFGVGKC